MSKRKELMGALAVLVLLVSGEAGASSEAFLAPSARTHYLLDMQNPGQAISNNRVGRILFEGVVGVGLGIGSTALGALLAADYEPPASLILPMSLLLLGSSAGVAAVGGAMDGGGSFGAAVLGSALGFAVPLIAGTGILAANGCSSPSGSGCAGLKPLAISLLVLPTIGAIIGYEISARLVPTLTPAQQGVGATLGLAGTL